MCNAFEEYEAFPFDKKIHVVAHEQDGYFAVVFKALSLLDALKFEDKQYHLSMGMVHFSDRKMSSRTGDIVTVDTVIDQVKEQVLRMMKASRIITSESEKVAEKITIGAIKYSVLKVNTAQDAAFDIEQSISLEGNSGPYIQYTYARTQSVLEKANVENPTFPKKCGEASQELTLLRILTYFEETVVEAGMGYAPNVLCNYLFELCQAFNMFYQTCPILESFEREFRLALTATVGKVLKKGLYLLGIEAPQRM